MNTTLQQPQKLVLWGHSLADYQEMFALTEKDLTKRVIDCYPGAASFNAELTKQKGHVVSIDELYALAPSALKSYVEQVFQTMLEKIRNNRQQFVWTKVKSLDDFAEKRKEGVDRFLNDFDFGKKQQRYLANHLPTTDFPDSSFNLALCSHFLFGLRKDLDLTYHINVLMELCRIAEEVRVFPLIDSDGNISPLVGPVLLALQQKNIGVEVREVPYQLQKNGNAMMRLWAQSCAL